MVNEVKILKLQLKFEFSVFNFKSFLFEAQKYLPLTRGLIVYKWSYSLLYFDIFQRCGTQC